MQEELCGLKVYINGSHEYFLDQVNGAFPSVPSSPRVLVIRRESAESIES